MARQSLIFGRRPTTSWATQLGELKREQFNLRFQAATNQLEKPTRVREVRREIARIKTLQSERVRAAATKLRKEATMPKRVLTGNGGFRQGRQDGGRAGGA